MNRTAVAALSLTFGWCAADAGGQIAQPPAAEPLSTRTSQPAALPVDLRFRVPPGTVLRYRLSETSTTYLKDAVGIKNTLNGEAIMRFTVKSEEGGKKIIEATCEAIKFTAKAGAEEVSYDSAKEPANERDKLVETRTALLRQRNMTITLEADGMVREVPKGVPPTTIAALADYGFTQKPMDAPMAGGLGVPVGVYLARLGSASNVATRVIFIPDEKRPERASVGQTWLSTTEGRDPPLCELTEVRDGQAIIRLREAGAKAQAFRWSMQWTWDTSRGVLNRAESSSDTGVDQGFKTRRVDEYKVELLDIQKPAGK